MLNSEIWCTELIFIYGDYPNLMHSGNRLLRLVRIGPCQHVAAYKMLHSDSFNIVFVVEETRDPSEWHPSEYVSDIKMRFEGWDPL